MSSFINSPCGIWMTEDTNRKTLRISLKATNCHLKHLFHFHRRDFFWNVNRGVVSISWLTMKQNQRRLKSVYQSLKLRLIYPDVKKKHVLLFSSYNKTFKFSSIDNTFNSVLFVQHQITTVSSNPEKSNHMTRYERALWWQRGGQTPFEQEETFTLSVCASRSIPNRWNEICNKYLK